MGWTILPNVPSDRRAFMDRQFTWSSEQSSNEIVKSAMVGTTYYAAARSRDGTVYAIVALTRVIRGEFCFKDFSDGDMPYYFDCPASILQLLTPTTHEYSIKWRDACAERIANKKLNAKNTPKVNAGDTVVLAEPITFNDGVKRGSFVAFKRIGSRGLSYRCIHTGALVKLAKKHLVNASIQTGNEQ